MSALYFPTASPLTFGSFGGRSVASEAYTAVRAFASPAVAARAHSASTARTAASSSADKPAGAAAEAAPSVEVWVLGAGWQAVLRARALRMTRYRMETS